MTIIFAVDKPADDSFQVEQRWRGCTANLLELARKNIDVQLIGENILLISLDRNLSALAEIIPYILGFGYRYTILSEDVKWTEVPGKA